MHARVAGWCISLGLAVLLGPCSVVAAEGDAQPLIEAGNRHWEAGELDLAMVSYQDAIEREPRSVDAHMKLAGLLVARQEYRAAVETFQQAISIDPDNANAFIGMAIGYLHLGDHPLAHAALEEALRIDPEKRGRVGPLMRQIEARLATEAHGLGAPPAH